jgi:hypothetical protein
MAHAILRRAAAAAAVLGQPQLDETNRAVLYVVGAVALGLAALAVWWLLRQSKPVGRSK